MIQNDGCPPAPLLEYQARLAARAATRDALNASDTRFAHARLATLASTVLLVVVVWRGGLSVWWLIVPAALLAWLARRHDLVFCDRSAAIRRIAFYERGLARLEDRWAGRGETGERFRDDHHVYANDLDLFGRASLFELLSLARTRGGEEMLAGWLTSPADAAEIRTRQAAVAELGPGPGPSRTAGAGRSQPSRERGYRSSSAVGRVAVPGNRSAPSLHAGVHRGPSARHRLRRGLVDLVVAGRRRLPGGPGLLDRASDARRFGSAWQSASLARRWPRWAGTSSRMAMMVRC
jgi:hypothetical protein